MELSADSGTLPTHTTEVGGPVLDQELSLSCQTESGGTIVLQLLEFKTHLLEAVEELHILRDAETRFEDQISKLVLEKQELEWEKESLQYQTATVANQHTETLVNVKKQFQAKIRNIEEEKGKYQVSAELKDKEINNLKEKLKSLQLLKYNLEKKSSKLEQKLALQNRSKDSHLNHLREVEKRFSALSRQCAMVKQAHEKLEQNVCEVYRIPPCLHPVDEAMTINKKLTSANEKQEATIVSLKKELEEVNNKLIKAKMSSVRHDMTLGPTGTEQRVQQLHQRLNMETEMNKKLQEENAAVRAEKQEVMRALQHTQQLLLSQTQTVSRVELELQTQREQYQALKKEHKVMHEKSKAMEDKVAQLMESYAASRTSRDKELLPTSAEEIRGEEILNEPVSSSEPPGFGSLQASTQTKSPDCLEYTGTVTTLAVPGSSRGQDIPNHHQQFQYKEPRNPSNPFPCTLTNSNLFRLCSLSGTTGRDSSMLNNHIDDSDISESDPDVASDLFHPTSSVSDDGLLISKGRRVSDTSTVSSPRHRPINGCVDLQSKEKSDEENGRKCEKEQRWKDDVKCKKHSREEQERNEGRRWNRKEVRGQDVMEGGSAGEKRGPLKAQTTDKADRREDSQRPADDAGDTKQPETETKDRAEERGKTPPYTPETQIPDQTTADTATEKSDTQQVIDFMDSEPPLADCEHSDCLQSLSQKVRDKFADSSHANKGYEVVREVHAFFSDKHQSVSHGPNTVLQHLSHDEAQDIFQQVFEKATEEKTEPSELSKSSTAQSDNTVSIQQLEASITNNMKQTDERCDTHVSQECVSVTTVAEPQSVPQSQEISEHECGQLRSLVTDDEDGGSYKKKEGQSNVDTSETDGCETAQEPVKKSTSKDACVDITMDTVDLESEVETGSCQEHMKNDRTEDAGDATTTNTDPSHLSYENDASPETRSAKCCDQPPAKEMLFDDTNQSFLPSNKTYRSSFDWGSAQRKTGTPTSEQNTSGPGGFPGQSSSTKHMFLKSENNKVPLAITRASDLLNASSVSGTAACSRTHRQAERRAMGETCRETATEDTESRASPSIISFPVSTCSITLSGLSWQTTPGCSRAPTSAAGLSSDVDWGSSCSQEREDQQSSLRAQISKIEQFLNTERLRLSKRRRTDN